MMVLHPYPGLPAPPVAIEAAAARPRSADRLELRFIVSGEVGRILLPELAEPGRADGLWKHTCFEAFVRPGDSEAYVEINLAPSRQWAAYAFDRYREGMRPADVALEAIEVSRAPQRLDLVATLGFPAGVGSVWRLALTAVIEDVGGGLSYWSLRHPAERPDFHDPVGLALELR